MPSNSKADLSSLLSGRVPVGDCRFSLKCSGKGFDTSFLADVCSNGSRGFFAGGQFIIDSLALGFGVASSASICLIKGGL